VDILARLSGDEFAIIQSARQISETASLAKRILDGVRTPFDLEGNRLLANVSIGIAMAPRDGVEEDQLLKKADLALYDSKAKGRGTYRFFSPEIGAA
jgi:diguanylate cyclase (GGDEF)-like protein